MTKANVDYVVTMLDDKTVSVEEKHPNNTTLCAYIKSLSSKVEEDHVTNNAEK